MTVRPRPGAARTIAGRALDFFYPRRCVACGRFGSHLCESCDKRIEPVEPAMRCPNCDAKWAGGGNCPRCFSWSALEGARAVAEMDGVARRLVHGLKYGRVEPLAPLMAQRMTALRGRAAFDVALPIPLHASRERDRGFNQAELLLRATDWPRAAGLRRIRKTRTQVGLDARERRDNVGGAFRYDGPALTGKVVALVDDVVTTGSTADECAAVLRDAGAARVWALSFARASYDVLASTPITD